jgi:hypothetical protein|tara:strand:- start:12 stop:287 length:276 start_codon:yes stop_codon:yes gene_type:complete
MAQTVAQVLTAATDSVTLINNINDGSLDLVLASMTQAKINEMVQRNVDHLTTILSYDSSLEGVPNIVDSSEDKSSYTTAITTGNTYISNNS